jgi:hypothetical protein
MSLAAYPSRDMDFDALEEVEALGLTSHVGELEARGYTIVPPEIAAATPSFVEDLRAAALSAAERRTGKSPDLATGAAQAGLRGATGEHHYYMLFEAPIFQQALLNPVAQALIRYLLGRSCVLSSFSLSLKGPGEIPLDLHSDNGMIPSPFPRYAQVANATWILTDYSREAGALCFTPGSHAWCRHPTLEEVGDPRNAIPVTAPAGSLIVWHGNTWHGAYPRSIPGLRVNIIMYFCRMYLRQQEDYLRFLTHEAVAALAPEVRRLIGADAPYPFPREGPQFRQFIDATTKGKLQHH